MNQPDRLPPYDHETEEGFLGAVLMSAQECMDEAVERCAKVEWFYDVRNQIIFDAMICLYANSKNFDIITLTAELKRLGRLNDCGGLAYISALPDKTGGAAMLGHYSKILLEKYQLRQTITTCTTAAKKAFEESNPVELIAAIGVDLARIAEGGSIKQGKDIRELVQDAIEQMEKTMQGGGITGLPTGFSDLDKMTGGLVDGDVIIIAARPSAGKSAMGMQIAENLAIAHKIPAAFFSAEMNPRSLVLRTIGSVARVNIRKISQGFAAERDFPKLTGAAGKVSNAPLYIEDACGWTAQQIRARARRLQANHGIKLAVVDYLQLVQPTFTSKSREVDVASISKELKLMARELNIPVIVLCQMNRAIETSKGRRPILSDLRESGAIEQDGDIIGFLYPMPQEEGANQMMQETKLIIVKQRNGPTGDVDLMFLKEFTRFEQVAKITTEDYPRRQHND